MEDILKFKERLAEMSARDAMDALEKRMKDMPEPDDWTTLTYCEVCHFLAMEENSDELAERAVEVLMPHLDSPSYEYARTGMLEIIAHSWSMLERHEECLQYAQKLYELDATNPIARSCMAESFTELGKQTEFALELVDGLLADGMESALNYRTKLRCLLALERFDEVEEVAKYADITFPEHQEGWSYMRIECLEKKGEPDKASVFFDKLLSGDDEDTVMRAIRNKRIFLANNYSEQAATDFLHEMQKKYPVSPQVLGLLATFAADINESIDYFERAAMLSGEGEFNRNLLDKYAERNAAGDEQKFFEIIESYDKKKIASWQMASDIVYGKFGRFDPGYARRSLDRVLKKNPNFSCGYSLLGKMYEVGYGVKQSLATAVKYYQKAHQTELGEEKGSFCGCGSKFLSAALYYGRGVKQDRDRAKNMLIKLFDTDAIARGDYSTDGYETDMVCLYAVYANDGDSRFDKTAALAMLKNFESDVAAMFLVCKFSVDADEKAEYMEKCKAAYENEDALNQTTYGKYLVDSELDYVHFVRN